MKLKLALLMLLIATGLTVAGCQVVDAPRAPTPGGSLTARQVVVSDCGRNVNKDQHPTQSTSAPHPIRIVFAQDKSGSSNWSSSRTSQVTENDLTVPIDLLRCSGGELAVGIVDDVSNKSLVRLRIDVPPTPPTAPTSANVFVRANEDADYQRRVNDYNARVAIWQQETDTRVMTFLPQVAELLNKPSTAKRTSVWNAIARADLMLAESDVTWPQPTHRFAVLNSDCIETARTKPIEVKSGATWIVVNGAGSVGVAEALKPERFENPAAAFEFIKAKELGGK